MPICEKFKGVLLDAYGVFWGGNAHGLLSGSKEMMEELVSSGKVVGILSNSTQLVSKERDKLQAHGIIQGEHFHFLITSGEVMRATFLNEALPFKISKGKFWLFGGVHPKFALHEAIFRDTIYQEASVIEDADFIYLSAPHINGEDQVDPESFRESVQNIRSKNLPMICPNPDLFAHEGKPARAVVRQGSIAKMYEELGGQVFYVGKPYSKVYSIAFAQFCKYEVSDPSEILMVGDTPETDIRGARSFGMASALVVQTGIMADRVLHKGLEHALKEMVDTDTPNYLIGRFANGFCSSP